MIEGRNPRVENFDIRTIDISTANNRRHFYSNLGSRFNAGSLLLREINRLARKSGASEVVYSTRRYARKSVSIRGR